MKQLKNIISENLNIRNSYIVSMLLLIAFILIASTSYAFFTARAERKGALNIVTGNLYSFISSKDFNEEKQVIVAGWSKKEIEVEQLNVNGIEAKLNFYYSTTSEDVTVGYTKENDPCPTREGIVLPKSGDEGDKKTYKIIIENNGEQPATITFGSNVGLSNKDLTFPVDKKEVEEYKLQINGLPYVEKSKTYDTASEEEKKGMFEIEHPDGSTSYRYIGSSPNNYVTFNGEDKGWRIIGVTNEENASGIKEWRIKLIRANRIGYYSWDNSNATTNGDGTSGNNNGNYGSNKWERPSELNKILNDESPTVGLYWNRQSGTCPYGQQGATTSCNFTSNGLTDTSHDQIENMRWYLGGTTWDTTRSTDGFYTSERGSETCKTKGNCTASRATTTNGNVGLPYPSDWGYTYAKGVADGCFNTPSNSSGCGKTNAGKGWMFSTSYSFWTLSPRSDYSSRVSIIASDGTVNSGTVYNNDVEIRPVVYLKSNIQLSGDGTVYNPYIIKN